MIAMPVSQASDHAPAITRLDPARYRRTPWKNGGGVAIDIADAWRPGAVEGDWSGMIWRFGRTAIVAPGPFSDLSGYDRLQTLVAGRGLVLETPDGEIDVRAPFRPVRFRGETAIMSRLEAGPVEVVNLIGDRDLVEIDLRIARAGESLPLRPGIHIAYAPSESAKLRIDEHAHDLAVGHAVRVDIAREALLACGAGVALVASIYELAR
jgi:environmental stress-induced protein Ves